MCHVDPGVSLLSTLESFFAESAPISSDDTVLVAFSGGPDSTALLWGLSQLRNRLGFGLLAGHVDHHLDPGSTHRAERSRRVAEALAVELRLADVQITLLARLAQGTEAAAREARYGALEEMRAAAGARYVATAHHRDDQIETVLLRLAAGSGWEGLAAIPARRGTIVRPLLALPKQTLVEIVSRAGLPQIHDPANRDLSLERNQMRDELLPYLEGIEPGIGERTLALANAARGARHKVEGRLRALLEPVPTDSGAELDLESLRQLPVALLPPAAALLHRVAGRPYPPARAAISELARQLAEGNGVRADCGAGWQWRTAGGRFELGPRPVPLGDFTYTLKVPGSVEVPEISRRLRVFRAPVADWMFQGSSTRTALGPALQSGDRVVVRNRRPGDRLRPLGAGHSRKLKDILIDRRVPRAERERIPLLCVGEQIAWVPGVTIDDEFRVGDEHQAWVAELEAV